MKVAVAGLAVVLALLNVYPWFPGEHEPVVLGLLPATLFFWLLWGLAFMGLLAYVAFRAKYWANAEDDLG